MSDIVTALPSWAFGFLAIMVALVLVIAFVYPARPIELGKLGKFGFVESRPNDDWIRRYFLTALIGAGCFLAGVGLISLFEREKMPRGTIFLVDQDIGCPVETRRLSNVALPTSAEEVTMMPLSEEVARSGESPNIGANWPTLIYTMCHAQ